MTVIFFLCSCAQPERVSASTIGHMDVQFERVQCSPDRQQQLQAIPSMSVRHQGCNSVALPEVKR